VSCICALEAQEEFWQIVGGSGRIKSEPVMFGHCLPEYWMDEAEITLLLLAAYPVRFSKVSLACFVAFCCNALYQNLLHAEVDQLILLQARGKYHLDAGGGYVLPLAQGKS